MHAQKVGGMKLRAMSGEFICNSGRSQVEMSLDERESHSRRNKQKGQPFVNVESILLC